jgi:hypothetical protein
MKRNYRPGKGCKCEARCQCECGCGADWTPTVVYRLRAELKRATTLTADERRNLAHALEHVLANGIGSGAGISIGWFTGGLGGRKRFIARHRRTIAMLQEWLGINQEKEVKS